MSDAKKKLTDPLGYDVYAETLWKRFGGISIKVQRRGVGGIVALWGFPS
jgi:hypothetical protein